MTPVGAAPAADALSEARPFILISGCPRSGTYLLAQYLQTCLGIAIPLETHFIPHFSRYLGLWGNLHKTRNAQRLVAAIEAYTRTWVYFGTESAHPDRQAEISLLPELRAARDSELPASYSAILRSLYAGFSARHGCFLSGDKSAPYDPEDLTLYDRSLTDMRVIHVIRDGRDVCLSWRNQWFGPPTVGEAAALWTKHVCSRREWGASNADRYHEIRYEDFLSNPTTELACIARFLGLPSIDRVPQAPEGTIASALSLEATHSKLGQALDTRNIARWTEEMSTPDIQVFESIASQCLSDCGYRSTMMVAAPLSRRTKLRLFAGRIRYCAPRNFAYRRIRSVLPLLIALAQHCGINATTFVQIITGLLRRKQVAR